MLSKLWYNFEHRVLKNAVKVFAITGKIANTVKEIQDIDATANFPGMDINNVTEFHNKENALIAVSMWDHGRKPELYLDIIEQIQDFVLYFVGNFRMKDLENAFKEEVKRRKLEERVLMEQGIKESDLIELYQKSKFVIRFGFGEYGLGTSTTEAIQNCVPLIINSDLGTADMVREYQCGEVLQNISGIDIRNFIERNNNSESYRVLQNNILKLSHDYTWRSHAEKLLEF